MFFKLCIWLLLWHIQGSFLSGQLFIPLRILTNFLSWVNCVEADAPSSQAVPKVLCHCVHSEGEVFLGVMCKADQGIQKWSTVFRCLQIPSSLQFEVHLKHSHMKTYSLFYTVWLHKITTSKSLLKILTKIGTRWPTIRNTKKLILADQAACYNGALCLLELSLCGWDVKSKLYPLVFSVLWHWDFLMRATNKCCYEQYFSNTESSAIFTPLLH